MRYEKIQGLHGATPRLYVDLVSNACIEQYIISRTCATFSDKYGSSNFLAYVIPIASVHYI